jgi:hypothetical protein
MEVVMALVAVAVAVEAVPVHQAKPAPSVVKPFLVPLSLRELINTMPAALVVLLATPTLQARLTLKRKIQYGVRSAILPTAQKNAAIVARRLQARTFKP